jgi:hypothetical protein
MSKYGGEGSNLKKSMIYIDLKYQGETSLDYQYALNLRKQRARRKNKSFLKVGTSGRGWEKGKKESGCNCGCVLNPYMKLEE